MIHLLLAYQKLQVSFAWKARREFQVAH
jgi:hypothetical protein